jgi:2-polyprenyl-3-methyl-5-hydroxy-6-metoxy-1,4-benzoquinol methylase
MTLSDGRSAGDPLRRDRRLLPDRDEDRSEHSWWNTNAEIVERIWANDDDIRQALRAQYLSRARAFLTEGEFPMIFEVGSGSGWVGRSLVRGTNNRLLGIDLSEAQVEIAQKNAEAEGLGMQCTYVCSNLSDTGAHIKGLQAVSGAVIHAILHHLTWSEIDQVLTDVVRIGPGAKLFVYEPVIFRNIPGEGNAGLVRRLSRLLAVISGLCVLFSMRLYGRITSAARDLPFLQQVDRVSKEAVENQWVLSPKEVLFDRDELLDTLGKHFFVKQSYLCNYLDMNAAYMTSILREPGREKRVFLKLFLPALRALDRWLVSSGAIYELCRGGRRSRVIDRFFPQYCFWGVECLPK